MSTPIYPSVSSSRSAAALAWPAALALAAAMGIGRFAFTPVWPLMAQEAGLSLAQGGWLASRGWVYVESPRGNAPVLPPNWQLHREGQAGEVRFALYRHALPLS